MRQCDCAVLVVDATCGLQAADLDLIEAFKLREIPYVIAYNKIDALLSKGNSPVPLPAQASECLAKETCDYFSKSIPGHASPTLATNEALISTQTGQGIYELKDLIGSCAKQVESNKRLVADLLEENDLIVLVIPIDSSAPKGRIILPQQMVMRDALDRHAICIACQPENLTETFQTCARKPRLVVTDSQAFEQVNRLVPDDLALTSFSILMARYKGNLEDYAAGAARLAQLNDNSKVLIAEGCTHHRQCDDIGTVKIPNWIRSFTNASPHFDFTSGGGFPESLEGYDLVIHCGACMLNDREMRYRIASCRAAGVPIVNYGIAIAEMHGILRRSLAPFPQASAAFKESF